MTTQNICLQAASEMRPEKITPPILCNTLNVSKLHVLICRWVLVVVLMLLTTASAWATITGSGTSTDPYVISSVSDWNTAAQNSTYTSAGVYVALGADLNLGDNASNNSKYFGSTCQMHFDGRGHTISGFYLDKSGNSYIALFSTLGEGGTITNLTVANSTIIGFKRVGGIVGRNMGTISNCHVESTVTIKAKENDSECCGGIAGENGYTVTGTVTNCTVGAKFELYNNALNEHKYGGIVGYNYKESPVSGCLCYSTNVTSGTTFKSIIGKFYPDGHYRLRVNLPHAELYVIICKL